MWCEGLWPREAGDAETLTPPFPRVPLRLEEGLSPQPAK